MTTSQGLIGSLNFQAQSDRLDVILEPEHRRVRLPLTRLVATLGPSSSSIEALTELLTAGMTIARFDFSWGSTGKHLETQRNLAEAVKATGLPCAIMLDILGTEVVVLNRDESVAVQLTASQEVRVTCSREARFSDSVIPISCRSLDEMGLTVGSEIFVGQYLFTGSENTSAYLTVKEVSGGEARCVVNNQCTLEGLQLTVHIADMQRNGPVLADTDIDALKQWAKQSTAHVDYLNISFCRNADDVATCRAELDKIGLQSTRLVAKIEDREGLTNFEGIIDAAEGIIFSRGNLGIDVPAEKMFLAQKLVMSACNFAGKPVIVARVVDTMIEAPRPTRAEATDVANLVLDGCDGILLGAETWMGRHPAAVATTVLDIARQAELVFNHAGHYQSMTSMLGGDSPSSNIMSKVEALASSAVRASDKLAASLIIAFTSTGRTARILAKYKPPVPVLAVVVQKGDAKADEAQWEGRANQCLLYRGVLPLLAQTPSQRDAVEVTARQLEFAIEHAKQQKLVKVGDQVVVLQCPQGVDQGSVKVVQVEDKPLDFSRLRLGSTADFALMGVGKGSPGNAPSSPLGAEGFSF